MHNDPMGFLAHSYMFSWGGLSAVMVSRVAESHALKPVYNPVLSMWGQCGECVQR